ncbi:DUF262 domain-containing protein [Corallococcus exiguus]|uniref:DUF262 domain-containing protein n=1 Tax=Corallococcus exiguus TaxID=83462 RepID=UPI0015612744|nr:DUF262 domain-containing protein [Corallococcus exiguus]NRD67523.1 DUF262 domain-containing protein [Corallococcus exiguus]
MQSELYSLSKLFTDNLFRIPDYQRGYAWTEKQLKDFWSDLTLLSPDRDHYTGVLTLEEVRPSDYERWTDDLWIIRSRRFSPFYVVDGQQRLTTSLILIQSIIESIDSSSELNYTTPDDIRRRFIFESKDKGISRSYIFGYEKDNPSYEFLKTKIFLEPSDSHGTGEETTYTHNLEAAKQFFLTQLKDKKREEIESIFTKITQRFLFNIYTIAPEIDVFVAFETMNNRGKPLSHLELLKNRLIFLSTLITTDSTERQKLRSVINESWKTIYHYLGKDRDNPLGDDHFLFTHFNSYIGQKILKRPSSVPSQLPEFDSEDDNDKAVLLDQVFTTRNLHDNDNDSLPIQLTINALYEYVHDLKRCVKTYYEILSPEQGSFDPQQKKLLAQLVRISRQHYVPLIISTLQINTPSHILTDLLTKLERYAFVRHLYVPRASAERLSFHQKAVEIVLNKSTPLEMANLLHERTERLIAAEGIKGTTDWSARGFYRWRGLKYCLFEYEQEIKTRSKANRDKLIWVDFRGEDYLHDYSTVEHVFPQKPDHKYWQTHFKKFTKKQKEILADSLGNLLPLSRPKNSALSNASFPEKCAGSEKTVGYRHGSHSEIEVSEYSDWTANSILERGLRMLDFIERRWQIPLGDAASKIKILGLDFIKPGSPALSAVTPHSAPVPEEASDIPVDSDPT